MKQSIKNLKSLLLAILILSPAFLCAQERITSKGQLPILGWFSIPAKETTVERYLEMKNAGFNISFSHLKTNAEIEQALEAANKAGIKIVITSSELKTETEKTVKKFMNNPALAGYFLKDEPNINQFSELSEWANKINSIDPNHFCYVNLFPNYANSTQLGTKDYRMYVNNFILKVPLHFYSFDSYPLTEISTIYADWYKNLEVFSEEARKVGKPFWAFAQSTMFGNNHETVSLATLRVQFYTDLAYGAQGLQYFTYWTPPANNNESFYYGPIGLDGKRTGVYDNVRLMNQELENLSGVFLGSKVISIHQTGKNIPCGTIRMAQPPFPLKVLETTGNGAIVSVLENGDKRFIVIVNRDYKKCMTLTLLGDDSLKKVLKNGTIVPASIYSNTIEVEPGDAAIYMYSTVSK